MASSTRCASLGELSQGTRAVHPNANEREEQSMFSGPGVFHLALVLHASFGAGILEAGLASLMA